jgi:hypothetical protein
MCMFLLSARWCSLPLCCQTALRNPPIPAPQLRAALEVQGGQLPGFMRMCDCVVRSSDEGGEGGKAAFSGMIMEKLNGGWWLQGRQQGSNVEGMHTHRSAGCCCIHRHCWRCVWYVAFSSQ